MDFPIRINQMERKTCTSILVLVFLLGVTATVFPNSAFVLGPSIDTQDALRRIHSKMTVPCSDENLLHWSGFYSISPYVSALAIKYHEAHLPEDSDFDCDLEAFLRPLFKEYYDAVSTGDTETVELAATLGLIHMLGYEDFELFFADVENLFPELLDKSNLHNLHRKATGFDWGFPWPVGQSWIFGGVHTSNGGNNVGAIYSSLDVYYSSGGPWGSVHDNDYVAASHDGVVTVYSTCSVRITHPSGHATSYYHLESVTFRNNQQITKGEIFARYANDIDNALCQGGSSNGPHLHFTLLFNGQHIPMMDEEICGYRIHSGEFSYDTRPEYMWLENDNIKYYAYSQSLTNANCDGSVAPTPAPTLIIKYWELEPCDEVNGVVYVRDCVDDTCCLNVWINDGYCDGEDQSWGCNLLCYPGENNDCGLFIVDCLGVVNGPNFADECDTCDSDPSNDCVQDCAGVWGGAAVEDACGQCDDNPRNDCVVDTMCTYESGMLRGNRIARISRIRSPEDCCEKCNRNPECVSWGYFANRRRCYLHGPFAIARRSNNGVRGPTDVFQK